MRSERFVTLLAVVKLPERCSCGSEEGYIRASNIEAPGGKLLQKVRCKGCGNESLIPDESEEKFRRVLGDKYRPTYYYEPKTGKLVHWSSWQK